MVIRSNKLSIIFIIVFGFCFFLCSLLFYLETSDVFAALLTFSWLSLILLRLWITVGRTLEVHREGITVTFLCFKKEYSWDDFELKSYTYYGNCLPARSPAYEYGAEFSKRRRGFKGLKAHDYGFIFRPFSLIFIYFDNEYLSKMKSNWDLYYMADGDEFRRLMKEWGVEMDDET